MAYTGNVHVSLYANPDYCNPGAIWASDQENPLQPGGSLTYIYNNASNAFGYQPPFFDEGYYFIGDTIKMSGDTGGDGGLYVSAANWNTLRFGQPAHSQFDHAIRTMHWLKACEYTNGSAFTHTLSGVTSGGTGPYTYEWEQQAYPYTGTTFNLATFGTAYTSSDSWGGYSGQSYQFVGTGDTVYGFFDNTYAQTYKGPSRVKLTVTDFTGGTASTFMSLSSGCTTMPWSAVTTTTTTSPPITGYCYTMRNCSANGNVVQFDQILSASTLLGGSYYEVLSPPNSNGIEHCRQIISGCGQTIGSNIQGLVINGPFSGCCDPTSSGVCSDLCPTTTTTTYNPHLTTTTSSTTLVPTTTTTTTCKLLYKVEPCVSTGGTITVVLTGSSCLDITLSADSYYRLESGWPDCSTDCYRVISGTTGWGGSQATIIAGVFSSCTHCDQGWIGETTTTTTAWPPFTTTTTSPVTETTTCSYYESDVTVHVVTQSARTANDVMNIWSILPSGLTHSPYDYDCRLKLKPVTGYSSYNINYSITSATGSCEGYYNELNGGFYQGFYKLQGYPYEVLPTRVECGWTVETIIRPRCNNICDGYTLNDLFPENKGIFFYMGTRAENKFRIPYSGENCIETCEPSCSGDSITLQTAGCSTHTDNCGNVHEDCVSASTYPYYVDCCSNNFALMLSGDCETGYRVGYRALYFSGGCVVTGTTDETIHYDRCGHPYKVGSGNPNCGTAFTYITACTVVNRFSDDIICDFTGQTEAPWLYVSAVFERDYCWDCCDLENKGGVNDLIHEPIPGVDSVFGYNDIELPTYLNFTKKWVQEKKFRMGTLTIYVNGRPVFVDRNFEEVIPRQLNTANQLQVGVPFNISWGGGSQGLLESFRFDGCDGCDIIVDSEVDCITENFAGTFMGAISQFRYYLKPLGVDEIQHNFLVEKDRYGLIDCQCGETPCNQGRAVYYTEGDSVDVMLNFPVPTTVLDFDGFDTYIDVTKHEGIKFKSILVDNVSAFTIKRYPNSVITDVIVETLPFCVGPNDIVQIIINRVDTNKKASATLIGNLYK